MPRQLPFAHHPGTAQLGGHPSFTGMRPDDEVAPIAVARPTSVDQVEPKGTHPVTAVGYQDVEERAEDCVVLRYQQNQRISALLGAYSHRIVPYIQIDSAQ